MVRLLFYDLMKVWAKEKGVSICRVKAVYIDSRSIDETLMIKKDTMKYKFEDSQAAMIQVPRRSWRPIVDMLWKAHCCNSFGG